MKLTQTRICLISMMFLLPAWTALSQQAQIVTGTRTGAGSVRLAVPEFPFETGNVGDQDRIGEEMAALFNETLWNDLEFSGVVELISRSFYPIGRFSGPLDVDPSEWTSNEVAAQFLTFGNASIIAGRFFVEAHLWDLETRVEDREVPGGGARFGGELNERSVRLIAHRFADRIVRALGGGIRGVFETRISFESDRQTPGEKEIWVMDYDGFNQFQLTTLRSLALTPSWHPDGERIAFTSYARGKPDVAVISPLDRRGFPFQEFEGTTTTPSWSPDGSSLAFASSMRLVRGSPDMEIYVADARGENLRRLTNSRGVDISPVWNPRTGRQIAFVSDRSGTPQIYVVDAEGGNLRRIIEEGGNAVDPAWSPNGQTIAFAWQRSGGSYNIYLHDLATGRNVQLTQNAGQNENPSWSPDGRHLVFESNRSGSRQIYSMLADGRSVRQLTNQGNNVNPSWSNYVGQ